MKDFLTDIVKNIVEDPNSVQISETEDNGRVNLIIKVADGDMGRVIGKDGKVINAIRMIMRVMAIRQNVKVRVDIEDNRAPEAPQTEPEAPQMSQPAEPVMEQTEPEAPTMDQPTAADLVGSPSETTVLDNSGN